jgi:hypothetical protein
MDTILEKEVQLNNLWSWVSVTSDNDLDLNFRVDNFGTR